MLDVERYVRGSGYHTGWVFFLSLALLIEKDLELFLSAPKSDKTDRENQLLHVSVRCFVRLIWTREDYSWMGGWLWKDYEDRLSYFIGSWDGWMEDICVCQAKIL